jgi:hypothetical protein
LWKITELYGKQEGADTSKIVDLPCEPLGEASTEGPTV